MAYFTPDHITAALDYLEKNGHPTLISVFSMLAKSGLAPNPATEARRWSSR